MTMNKKLNKMFTIQSPNEIFSATVQGKYINNTYFVYQGTKGFLYLRFMGQKPVIYTVLIFGAIVSPRRVEFQSDLDGSLILSLRNWMELVGRGNYLRVNITIATENETLPLFLNVLPGIEYAEQIRPSIISYKGDDLGTIVNLLPPNVMYSSPLRNGVSLQMETSHDAYDEVSQFGDWFQHIGNEAIMLRTNGTRNNQVAFSASADMLELDGSAVWNLVKLKKCKDMAILQWTSQTGAVRRHLFPVRKQSANITSELGVLNISDGITKLKNYESLFTVYVDGLTSYGWWYYADMFLASDLHAVYGVEAIEEGNLLEKLELPFTSSCCEKSEYHVPEGVGFFQFVANIKYRKYELF